MNDGLKIGLPGEEIVTTAMEKISDGILKKMDESEAKRDREFAYKLKELEFYKGDYNKELKDVFDNWFDLLLNLLLANQENLSEQQHKQYQQKVDKLLNVEGILKLKIKTIKYGGTKTGKALALFSQFSFRSKANEGPAYTIIYIVCFLLSTLKYEILGQEISPLTIMQILISDYSENKDKIYESKKYADKMMKELFQKEDF